MCEKCGGSGFLTYWMYNLVGATVVPSLISILLLLGLFIFNGLMSAFYLSFNEWIYRVEDMGFWFNRSFMTWLFAKHRERWAKWTIGGTSILSICFGTMLFGFFSLNQVTQETFLAGALFSIPVVILFSTLFYKSYTSLLVESHTRNSLK